MARSAKLTSIDAVRDMSAALAKFADELGTSLDDLDINVRRAVEWIEHDRKQYWENAVRRGWDRVAEARSELEKALTYRKVADRRPSCHEERAALEKAKQKVQMAEEIYRSLPQWAHRIEHAVRELTGAETLLGDWLHGDFSRAMAALSRMSESLESYAAVQLAASSGATTGKDASTPDASPNAVENKEINHERLGSAHAGGETPPGDEGSEGG
ncbi:MAG TPA: hypothetical protein VJL29_05085 [Thermoguttaceae bacterium]|nr:hypothetical protein [Thermoguttaceae bacterium]